MRYLEWMKVQKAIYAAILAASASLAASAQTGTVGYEFLELPTSTQSFGLGGAAPAVINDDVNLADQNPALIGPELEKQVGLSYMHWLGSTNLASVRYGMAAGERGAWMAGIRYINYGSMTATDPDGTQTGTFSPQDSVFEGAYSHDFTDRLRGGMMLKMVYSNYEQYTAFALATDLGINYYNDENDLSLSAVVKNLGGQIKRFDSRYDRLPIDVQLAYMQGLGSSPFSLAITAWHLTKWKLPYYSHDKNDPDKQQTLKSSFFSNFFRHLIFGLQYQPSDNFYINLGYNYKRATDMATYHRNFLSGFSAAIGLNVKAFRFGVGYAMPHKGGASLMINVSTNLAELLH